MVRLVRGCTFCVCVHNDMYKTLCREESLGSCQTTMIEGVRECGMAILAVVLYLRIYSIRDNLDELTVISFASWQLWRFACIVFKFISPNLHKEVIKECEEVELCEEEPVAVESKLQQAIREAREAQAKRVLHRISSMNIR